MPLFDESIVYQPEAEDEHWVEPPRDPLRPLKGIEVSTTDNELSVLSGVYKSESPETLLEEMRRRRDYEIEVASQVLSQRAQEYASARAWFNRIDERRHQAGMELKVAADALDAAQRHLDTLKENGHV